MLHDPIITPCAACDRGAAGIEGHEELRVRSLGAYGMAFTCRSCGARWNRDMPTHGVFVWVRAADGVVNRGSVLPPSGNPAERSQPSASQRSAMDHWLAIQEGWRRPPVDTKNRK